MSSVITDLLEASLVPDEFGVQFLTQHGLSHIDCMVRKHSLYLSQGSRHSQSAESCTSVLLAASVAAYACVV